MALCILCNDPIGKVAIYSFGDIAFHQQCARDDLKGALNIIKTYNPKVSSGEDLIANETDQAQRKEFCAAFMLRELQICINQLKAVKSQIEQAGSEENKDRLVKQVDQISDRIDEISRLDESNDIYEILGINVITGNEEDKPNEGEVNQQFKSNS